MLDESELLEVRAPRNKWRTYFLLILPIKSLITGAFGLAAIAALLILDADYALDWSLTRTVAIGASVFTALALFQLRRYRRRAIVGWIASWSVSLAVVFGVLFSGSVNDTHLPTVEAVGQTMVIQKLLERANSKGVAGTDWQALVQAEIAQEESTFWKYYAREDVSWSLAFNDEGEFKGEVRFRGDPLHNIPDCTAHINDRGRPVVVTGDFKKYLPVRPKDMQ